MFWRGRAFREYGAAPRTFFGTLTIAPENDVVIDALARIELGETGVDFDTLPDADKFRVRCKIGGREVTKYLKRLRESEVGRERPTFRYLFVAEQHSSDASSALKKGRPHWHCLFHEVAGGGPLVRDEEFARSAEGEVICDKHGNAYLADTSFLKRHWLVGHSRFQWCRTPQAATYVCKYLTKTEASYRIRASLHYGDTSCLLAAPSVDGGRLGASTDRAESIDYPPREGEKSEARNTLAL